MIAAGLILAALAGAVHVYIWVLESLLWTAFGHHWEIGPSASVIACPAGRWTCGSPGPVGAESDSEARPLLPDRRPVGFANPVILSEIVVPEHLAGGLNPVEHGEAEFRCRLLEVQFRRLELPDLRARTNEDAVVGVRAREEAVSVMERVAVVGSLRGGHRCPWRRIDC